MPGRRAPKPHPTSKASGLTPEPPESALPDPVPLEPEDAKLVALARSARARTGAAEAAAVRDGIGRRYVATTVSLPSLQLAALEAAVAAAVSSGAEGLEAAAVVTAGSGRERSGGVVVDGIGAVRDLASGARAVPVLVADLDGRVCALLT